MGNVMGISRLRMGIDGKGITTLVTLYGCPLQCKYCINSFCHEEDTIRAEYTAEEMIEVLKIDEPYFLMTDGGVTFGGGEPLIQSEFIYQICQLLNRKWNVRIETSLNVPWKNIERLLGYINQWIIDIKDIDKEIYQNYTGVDNTQVLENLDKLVEREGKEKILVRIPNIPNYNTLQNVEITQRFLKEKYEMPIEVFDYMV